MAQMTVAQLIKALQAVPNPTATLVGITTSAIRTGFDTNVSVVTSAQGKRGINAAVSAGVRVVIQDV